ncbi:MAG: AraC family transcriptional regulator [Megasphaera sp.]|jgi:AraC-like DNA-binding protein|nr:AraC family transcriptional regulator [Megasphaera sp.]MCH4188728.1 AraC family transcriptional regulator [Megasphaera sp.]MCH4218631.1 AraC family transcriptional regulator [Megasphaera sp.]
MAFIRNAFSSSFDSASFPRLISIYQAKGKITEMPRAMHKHAAALEIILITDGYGIHIIDGKKYYTEQGDLLIINSETVHDEASDKNINLSIYSCALTELHLPGLPANHLIRHGQPPIIKTGASFTYLSSLMELMYEYASHNEYRTEEVTNYVLRAFVVVLYGLVQHSLVSTGTKEENELARNIKNYVDNHYMEELKLAVLADQFHVSTYYLSHIYKNYYGYAPMQYVMRRRVGEAQTLLIDTTMPITAVAMQVGYKSSSYFHDIFTKFTGISPRNYRVMYHKI